jgi:hypothetical protein
MKKTLLLSAVGLLVAVVVGFWVYSFLYGSPTNTPGGLFTNLGLFGNNQNEALTPATTTEATSTPTVDVKTDRLRQLTTKPVIGMRVVTLGGSTVMRYVEAGTGQIFDIDMRTGTETRVSQISVPVASEAEVSPSGAYIAIRSGYTSQNEVVLITIKGTEASSKVLPNKIDEFHFSPTNSLLFTEFNNGVTEGKQYEPTTAVVQRIFTIPFTAVQMAWSDSTSTPHYVYTKPAESMMGYVYRISGGSIVRVANGINITALVNKNELLFGSAVGEFYQWYTADYTKRFNLTTTPEKCIAGTKNIIFYCGGELDAQEQHFLEKWYRGKITTSDRIIIIERNGALTSLVSLKFASGRAIDLTHMHITTDNKMLYFINKIDNTLWVYDL